MTVSHQMSPAEQAVAKKYRSAGYDVLYDVPPGMLPPAVSPYRPDFVAVRGDEKVAVEVKRHEDTQSDRQLLPIAEAFRQVPGWRLDLVVVEPENGRHPTRSLLTRRLCLDRLESADRLAGEGRDYAAAMVLLWTVFEAIMRAKIDPDDRARVLSPQRLAKVALSLGLVSDRDWKVIENLAEVRNRTVHGERAAGVSRRDYRRARSILDRLAESFEE